MGDEFDTSRAFRQEPHRSQDAHVRDAAVAILALRSDAPERLPRVEFPCNLWPKPEASDVLWRTAHRWNRAAWRYIRKQIEDPAFREATRAELGDERWVDLFTFWYADALHDGLWRETADTRALMLLLSAFEVDDEQSIAQALDFVLDQAGRVGRSHRWARVEAAWRGIMAIRDAARRGTPVLDELHYLRSYVGAETSTRLQRYGEDRPNDRIRVSDADRTGAHLKREPPRLLDDELGPASPEEQLIAAEQSARLVAALQRVARPDERGLVSLVAEGTQAAEAERRLGLPAGTWRNLAKRAKSELKGPD